MSKSVFKDRLRARRIFLGLSQEELAAKINSSKQVISTYETGARIPKVEMADKIAFALNVSLDYLMGNVESPSNLNANSLPSSLHPLQKVHYIPRIGRIACGTPILAEQNIQDRILLPDGVRADFALSCAGDSMIEASINDGDTVFIRMQPEVENGEIAAVLIGEEATLKRVYRKGSILTLMPANKDYEPLSYQKDELECVRIIGKATAVLRML
ncbi:MAG: S24 family peptidase [Bacillota bacterium]